MINLRYLNIHYQAQKAWRAERAKILSTDWLSCGHVSLISIINFYYFFIIFSTSLLSICIKWVLATHIFNNPNEKRKNVGGEYWLAIVSVAGFVIYFMISAI